MQNLQQKKKVTNGTRLDLLNRIWNEVGSAKQLDSIIASIAQMARYALRASFSSLYLLDDKTDELYLRCSNTSMENQLKRFKIHDQAGITGWVALNGQPLIVNNISKEPRFNRLVDDVYGSPAKTIICVPLIVHRKVTGVIKLINKTNGTDFNWQDLQTLTAVATTAALTVENLRLNECLQDSYASTVNALVSLADAKEVTGGGHSKRVYEYTMLATKSMSFTKDELRTLKYAAVLHDIGKLAIPDAILNKSEALTSEEWRIMRNHPMICFKLLKDIPFLEEASRIILSHHEKYDGTGYPHGMKGEGIPLGARIIAVADAFDNMTTERIYRKAMSKKDAILEVNKYAGTQFCPVAAKAFTTEFLKAQQEARLRATE
jgi:HD-GYP domain-containing protein (c-di-GMP phosphodiesterase class II)